MVSRRVLTTISIICLYFFSTIWLSQAQGPRLSYRFGIGEAYLNPAEVSAAGAGYSRLFFHWNQIQPNSGDDWETDYLPDDHLQAELAAGRDVVGVLLGTPKWANPIDSSPQSVPDMEAWGNFAQRIAQTYQGRIKYWVIWHEPDFGPTDLGPNQPNYYWAGTVEDYAALLKTAYFSIKQVDPTIAVHLAGLSGNSTGQSASESYLAQLLAILSADPEAARHNFYFDAVVYHLYSTPRNMLNVLTESRSLLDQYRLADKPIWVNEFNLPPNTPQLSEADHAAFVAQVVTLLAAGGAQRFQYYKLYNEPNLPGLLQADDTRKPAYLAYQTMARYLTNYTQYSWVQESGIYVITLDQSAKTTTIIWNTASFDQSYVLNAITSQALLVQINGQERDIVAENGAYSLTLPAATCDGNWCHIGGEPLILIEEGTSDQRESSLPLVEPTPVPTPIPTLPSNAEVAAATNAPEADRSVSAPAQAVAQTNQVSRPPGGAVASLPSTNQFSPASQEPNLETQGAAFSFDEAQPTSSAIPSNTSVSQWLQLIDTSRIISLIVIGALLFTFFYFVQFKVWHSIRSR